MTTNNEHGYCPSCHSDMDGQDIIQSFMDMGKSRREAKKCASYYGGGKWDRRLAITSWELDRVVSYRCPDCKHEWKR